MSSSHALLKYLRLTHLYLGVFIAPALLFFAFTGALQTFSLHETTRGSNYKPPAWVVTLAQIHKKQTTVIPAKKLPSDKAPSDKHRSASKPDSAPADATPEPKPHKTLPLKIFFLLVSIGLFVSTLTGLYMSYKYIRNRRLITVLLFVGTILPIALTLL
jgi:hypothetical protein